MPTLIELVFIAIVLLVAVLLELLVPVERVRWQSRAVGGYLISAVAVCAVLIAYVFGGIHQTIGVEPFLPPIEEWAGWAALPITLMVKDFLNYWEHRIEHRYFWNIHAVHHSPHELHAMTNYGHPLHSVPLFFLVILPLSLLNFTSITIPIIVTLVVGVQNALSHSPVNFHFGPLRRILVDNRFHRIHHSLEPRHFDKNFAVIFSFWDRLFGTAYFPDHDEWPKVGVAGLRPPENLKRLVFMPFQKRSSDSQGNVEPVAGSVA